MARLWGFALTGQRKEPATSRGAGSSTPGKPLVQGSRDVLGLLASGRSVVADQYDHQGACVGSDLHAYLASAWGAHEIPLLDEFSAVNVSFVRRVGVLDVVCVLLTILQRDADFGRWVLGGVVGCFLRPAASLGVGDGGRCRRESLAGQDLVDQLTLVQ
ncbi:hypothetical protein [Amycolatopsis orientalis]|uniref:hypothetical protein n=1 Tax=Amycolatopsis orientalis TaxID=31958 RepID=UPI00039F8376|nr:hypothetical protein [Amycolatopsis orientalis]